MAIPTMLPAHLSASTRAWRRFALCATCASTAFLVGAGCLGDPFQFDNGAVEVLAGTDSAGAAIEIVTQKSGKTNARVSDVVLGTAEAEVTRTPGYITFTLAFPAGVTITYTANTVDETVPDILDGVWVQHAGHIFGQDGGTWTVMRDRTLAP